MVSENWEMTKRECICNVVEKYLTTYFSVIFINK